MKEWKSRGIQKKERKKVGYREQRCRRSPLPPAPPRQPSRTRTRAAARPARGSRQGAMPAWLGAGRGSRPGPPRAGGSHGATSPGAERSPGPRNVLRAPAAAPLAGPSGRERGGGGPAGRSPHRALPAGGKTRPGSPRPERDSPPPAAHPRPRVTRSGPGTARGVAVPPRLPTRAAVGVPGW